MMDIEKMHGTCEISQIPEARASPNSADNPCRIS